MRSEVAGSLIAFSYGSFLLTFPNFGPVSLRIIEATNTPPYLFFSQFYVFHILGIALSAILLDRVSERIRLLKIVTLILIISAFTALLNYAAIMVIGFLMGIFVVILGTYFARFVEPWKRGRTFALGAFLSNVYLFLLTELTSLSLQALVTLSVIPLLLVFLIPGQDFEGRKSGINGRLVLFALPVFVFYLVGGVMYGIMEVAFRNAGISTHILFYAITILLAGIIYDRVGRKAVAIVGLIALSLSLLLFPSALVYSAHLIQSSYAFVDVFAMMVWADLSNFGAEARQYGIGMLFVTVPVYLGYVLSNLFTFQLSTTVLVILIVLSAFLIGSAGEPLVSPDEYMRWLVRR